jgi:T5SS/PEP-CTERM-associated repeat protein
VNSNSTGLVKVTGDESILTVDSWMFLGNERTNPAGTLVIENGGTVDVASLSRGNGLLSLEGGTLRITDGEIFSHPSSFSWTAGTLQVGSIFGNLVVPNGGVLALHRSLTTTVTGSYNQQAAGAVLAVDISGASIFGELAVDEAALLGGSLQVSLKDGFVPSPSDTYDILQSEAILSAFGNVANGQRLMTSDGLGSFVVNYGTGSSFSPNHVILSAFAPGSLLPGDYNQDGAVDAADYVVWRNNLGSGTSLPNDDTTGVGPDDYTRWRKNFGQTPAAGLATANDASFLEAVPEPSFLNLSWLAISMLALKRVR